MSTYDTIVIGGGHNGLTTATLLAKKGQKVLVLEKRNTLGGIAAGEEFYPSYRTTGLLHDTTGIRAEVVQSLELEKFGLKLEKERPTISILSDDGQSVEIHHDPKVTAASIRTISPRDASAYLNYQNFLSRISRVINDLMDQAPPQVSVENLTMVGLVALAKKGLKLKGLGNKTMLELLRVAPMCVADFLNEHFETDFIKAGLAAPALYGAYAGPWSAYSTINLLLWECAARNHIIGGPQALVNALEQAARASGVELQTNAEVSKIILDHVGQVKGIRLLDGQEIQAATIAASCTPKVTFLQLLDEAQIDYELEHWIQKTRSRGTTAKINLALNQDVELNGQRISFARTGDTFDKMDKAFDPVKYREVTVAPFLDIHIPTVAVPSLAPDGHSVVSVLAHQIPYDFKEGWNAKTNKQLESSVLNSLEKYFPGIREAVVHAEVLSPLDLEEKYALTEGHVYHGEHFVDQLLTRPIPSCMHYRTPVSGLFLCGSGSHPGGGITCSPGSMAAKEILASG